MENEEQITKPACQLTFFQHKRHSIHDEQAMETIRNYGSEYLNLELLRKIVSGILCTLVLLQGSWPIPLSVELIEDVLNCLSGSSQKVILVSTALLSEITTSTTFQPTNFVLSERLINVKRLLPLEYLICIAQYKYYTNLSWMLQLAAATVPKA